MFSRAKKPLHSAPMTIKTINKNARRGAPGKDEALHRYAFTPRYGKAKHSHGSSHGGMAY